MKHVIFVMGKIATVMENVLTIEMIIFVNVYQITLDKTVNTEIFVTLTRVHMETVQTLIMVSNVHVQLDSRVVSVMQ